MRNTGLAIAAAVFPAVSFADGALSRQIDAVFAGIDSTNAPGCAAGVIHDGEYVHKAGYGLANMEYRIPISSESVFRTGSVSKQFTAMAIALLAESGDIDLDADIHTYLPDLVNYGHRVTVRQMVHHIAGMGDYDHEALRKSDGSEFRFGNEDFATTEEFYAQVAKANLINEPGTRYEYSNLGYFLLAQLVERVSKKPLRDFAATEIFGRLEMDDSLFNDNANEVVRNRAYGYRRTSSGDWNVFVTNLSWVGDGGVFTSLDDFIKWDRNFYDNKLGRGNQSLIDLVQTPHPGTIAETPEGPRDVQYAFGMRVAERYGQYAIVHSGSWVAFTSIYERFPELNLSVAVFCNSTEVSAPDLGDQVTALAVDAAVKGRL